MPVPPKTVQNNAKKGLEARDKAVPSKKGMTRVGLARANQLARGDNISIPTLKRMKSYLARARTYYDAAKEKGLKPEDSPAIQAYLGWGGVAAIAWVNSQLKNQ